MLSVLLSLHCIIGFAVEKPAPVLPQEAQSYLNKIPGRTLTPRYVIGRAIQEAEAYKQLGLSYHEADLNYKKVEVAEEWAFTAGGSVTDNQFEPTGPFDPVRRKGSNWNLGLNKQWSTGTNTSLNWAHNYFDVELSPQLSGGAFAPLTNYRQTIATVALEQSLLKNFFGYSYNKQLDSARELTNSIKDEVKAQFEDVTIDFLNAFYSAWLAQQQVRSVQDQVKRRERLMRVTKRKRDRGVVEAPEYIQIEALLSSTKSDLAITQSELTKLWQALVLNLRLPISFLQIDPLMVPTALDNPMATSMRLCYNGPPKATRKIMALEQKKSSAEKQLRATANNALPDLKLKMQYQGNGIDGRSSPTFEDVWQGNGPAWEVGLNLEWPLSNLQNRLERKTSYINMLRAESQLQQEKDNLQTDWLNNCRLLKVEMQNEARFLETVQKQRKRVKAEEKRFSLGRITVDQLVTAEDDLGQWEFRYHSQAVKVRNIAWQVQKIAGELFNQMAPLIEGRLNEKPN